MSTIIKAFETFRSNDDMTGQVVEASLDQLYFRKEPEYANASQKWMKTESAEFWDKAYQKVAEARNGV